MDNRFFSCRRGDSRRKEPRAGNVKVINLPNREEVKLNEAENAWKPTPKKEVKDTDDVEVLCKKIRSILNKLCPQKFDVLVGQFNDLVTDTEEKLTRAMHLVFEKAVDEPGFSVAYARMCLSLGKKNVIGENGTTINFRALLLKRWKIILLLDHFLSRRFCPGVRKSFRRTTWKILIGKSMLQI